LYALLGASTVHFPHAHVSLIFLPMIPFEIQHVFPALVALDGMGILLRWRLFDHVAHASGAAFGWWYAQQKQKKRI